MDNNRKFIVFSTIFLIVFLGLLMITSPEAEFTQPSYWLSLAIGVALGFFTCLYLRAVWDPKYLQLKNPDAGTADPKWMGPTVIMGVIASKIGMYIFAPDIQIMLVNIMFAWYATSSGYMAFQVWWHRPKL